MFSIITIASSTTKPEAMVSAISDRLLRLKPKRYIAANVPTIDSGTDRLGMSVARVLRRKTKITRTTSTTASDSSNSTSCTEARIVTVRSVSTAMSTSAGSASLNCGRSALMRSTTAITLAPGWRSMLRITAGVVPAQPVRRLFSDACTDFATSLSRTGSPFL